MKAAITCLTFSCLLLVSALNPSPTMAASSGFSPQAIKQLYQEGEFEKVRTQLEAFLKSSDATASREERIMAYKYLGVVYAAKPEGRPQAEAYFFRLLDLSPNVQLTELYVSSAVNSVFEKTQQRFLKEKQSSTAVDEFGNPIESSAMPVVAAGSTNSKAPIPNASRQQVQSENKGVKIWPWVLGAAVVGGGISLYVMTSGESDKKKEVVVAGTPE